MELCLGVEVIVNNEVLLNAPSCSHGPTLLFKRLGKNGNRLFYACAACRDRKSCRFFQWVDDKKAASGKRMVTVGDLADKTSIPKLSAEDAFERLKEFQSLPPEKRRMCKLCSQLLLPSDISMHVGHPLRSSIMDSQLQAPTYLLEPLENGRKEAQFFFSKRTTTFIISTLKHLAVQYILCIGCPRIHEYICNEETNMRSLLLDIDSRLHLFNSPEKFCHYNMFNHHFFNGDKSKAVYYEFLRRAALDKLIVLMDPPFGGLVEPLAHSLTRIQTEYYEQLTSSGNEICSKTDLQVLWIFPYFMEKKIIAASPAFKMLDYEVDYDNHPLYKTKDSGRKRVSPIRIFTNIEPKQIRLPVDEGYRFCEKCQRDVAEANQHCDVCKCCPSKDGRPYKHCDMCGYCVKASYTHCIKCESCLNPQHSCAEVPKTGCHLCGSLSHKRKHCPESHKNRNKRAKMTRNRTKRRR